MTPKEKEPAFKVVDRRRFTEEGEENVHNTIKNDVDERQPKEKVINAQPNDQRPPLNFSFFIQSLAHQTMMALGIIPWPDSGLVRVELGLAKETIDILNILHEKTVGNLSKDEEHLLKTLVYQLKMAFIEIVQKAPDNAPPSIIK